jgi:hypothetical protein
MILSVAKAEMIDGGSQGCRYRLDLRNLFGLGTTEPLAQNLFTHPALAAKFSSGHAAKFEKELELSPKVHRELSRLNLLDA